MQKIVLLITCLLTSLSLLIANEEENLSSKIDAIKSLEVSNIKPYDFKIYMHKDSIDIYEIAGILQDEIEENQPEVFLYVNSTSKLRLAAYLKNKWHTWEIFDLEYSHYYVKMERKNFDNLGNSEIIIELSYRTSYSSFGEEYTESFEIWDIDNVNLYFQINNGQSVSPGRNSDEDDCSKSCTMEVEVQEERLLVKPVLTSYEGNCDMSYLTDGCDTNRSGEYLLKNGKAVQQRITHLVKKNETVFSICKKYGIEWEDFKLWNGLENNQIKAQKNYYVSLPILQEVYKVKQNDTLYSLCKEFQIHIAEFRRWNDFKKGEKILIGKEYYVSPY